MKLLYDVIVPAGQFKKILKYFGGVKKRQKLFVLEVEEETHYSPFKSEFHVKVYQADPEIRARTPEMDAFMAVVNGSPRWNVEQATAAVNEALKRARV